MLSATSRPPSQRHSRRVGRIRCFLSFSSGSTFRLGRGLLVAVGEVQGLAAILGPVVEVRESPCIPRDLSTTKLCEHSSSKAPRPDVSYLQHHLRKLHGMAAGALAANDREGCRPANGVSNMVPVVWCVEVLPVPAASSPLSAYFLLFQQNLSWTSYRGKMMFDRIPPTHGFFGK